MMRFLLFLSVLVSALSLTAFAQERAAAKQSAELKIVQDYLKQFAIIRVGITKAPGSGHQSAGATLITRLRELGFDEEVQVVYDSEVKKQLGYLIPPFDSTGDDKQSFPEKKISFIEMPESREDKLGLEEVELAMMGADDQRWTAEDLRAKKLVTLQPMDWAISPSIQLKGHPKRNMRSLKPLGYVFHLPDPQNPMEFIEEQMGHTYTLAAKVSGLQAIVAHLSHLEMTPAYGHKITDGYQALIFLAGIHNALQKEPKLFKGGVVVPLISELTVPQKRHLQRLIGKTSLLQNSVKISNVTDPNLESKCAALQNGEILLVHTGAVSKPVFEYLYQIATLPPVVEGKNSINLAQLIGRPYLPSDVSEGFHFSEAVDATRGAVFEFAKSAFRQLWSKLPKGPDMDLQFLNERAESIGDFVIESKKLNSDLNNLFSNYKVSVDSSKKDKVVQGLLAAQKWEAIQRRLDAQDELNKRRAPKPPVDIYKSFLCEQGMLLKE